MDRIDAMKVFVAALDEGSLAGAGHKLGRSPAAVSRALAFLEGHVGMPLLHRTTRSSKLSEVGERFDRPLPALAIDLDEAETAAASESRSRAALLSLDRAGGGRGRNRLRPLLDDFLDAFPTVTAKLVLLDQPANLIDEGIDVALRIGHLVDLSMVAVRVGEVRKVVVAAPSYLARSPAIQTPGDLTSQRIISSRPTGVGCMEVSCAATARRSRACCRSRRASSSTARGGSISAAVEGTRVGRGSIPARSPIMCARVGCGWCYGPMNARRYRCT